MKYRVIYDFTEADVNEEKTLDEIKIELIDDIVDIMNEGNWESVEETVEQRYHWAKELIDIFETTERDLSPIDKYLEGRGWKLERVVEYFDMEYEKTAEVRTVWSFRFGYQDLLDLNETLGSHYTMEEVKRIARDADWLDAKVSDVLEYLDHWAYGSSFWVDGDEYDRETIETRWEV